MLVDCQISSLHIVIKGFFGNNSNHAGKIAKVDRHFFSLEIYHFGNMTDFFLNKFNTKNNN
jgi:hypothetical protein